MKNKVLKIGLIGVGRLGRHYVDYLYGIRQARLTAVADIDATALAFVDGGYDVPEKYADYHDLLASKEVDAVVIVSPTDTHCEVIEAAARAGKAIFCEKPLTLSLDEALATKRVLEETGCFFQIGFMRRYDRGYMAAKHRIERGEIGRPVFYRGTSRDPFPPSIDYIRTSGGIFLDMGIHDIDLAYWCLGDVKSVYGQGAVLAFPEFSEAKDVDNALISLEFKSGALGSIDLTRNGVYGYDIKAEVVGTEGSIDIGYLRETPIKVMKEVGVLHDTVPFFKERFGEAFSAQLQDFVGRVLEARTPSITCEDSIATLRIALAARKSCIEHRVVEVDEV